MSSLDTEQKEEKTMSPEVNDSVPGAATEEENELPKPKAKVSTGAATSEDVSSDDEDENEPEEGAIPSSQLTSLSMQPLSQMDEEIRLLEKGGELGQVVGSQSMLSQELLVCSSQRSMADDDAFEPSTTGNSTALARRLGLLPQAEEEKKEPDHDVDSSFAVQEEPAVPTTSNAKPPRRTKMTSPSAAASKTKQIPVSDTPVRESECFGSLLEAVEQITKEEEMNAKMVAWEHNSKVRNGMIKVSTSSRSTKKKDNKTNAKRKSPTSASSSSKKSRTTPTAQDKAKEQRAAQEIAKRAAALAEQTITDPDMAKKLLLSMALVRENPRSMPNELPPRGSVVPEGFFWAHYPPLEAVLKKHMAKYYDLSTTKCQSAQQQAFNNDLVVFVRRVAREQGWRFDESFSDKGLRDRIRCYYKTHIQNAKKRLRTMVRNPTKRANARHLCSHLDLIQQHGVESSSSSSSVVGNEDNESVEDENSVDKEGRNGESRSSSQTETTASNSSTMGRHVFVKASRNLEETMSRRVLQVPAFEV